MLRYLECFEVKQSETDLDDIIDGTIAPGPKWASEQLAVYSRQNKLLAKIISTSLSCTLSRQVMDSNSGSEMWSYLSKRFEGRENATTTLSTQRTLRQKLDLASCRPGADVANHLNYMMSLREQLTALKADVGDAWMVDLMVRSMSQYSYYTHLQTLRFIGSDKLNSPVATKSIILTLDKNALVEKQLQAPCNRSLVGDKRYFLTYRTLGESEKESIYSIHGITMPKGVGTIEIWWNVQGNIVSMQLENVYYAKDNENLISQYKMETQGYKVYYDTDRHVFPAKKDDVLSTWRPEVFVNYIVSDGVEDLQRWHERLGHTCPQHMQIMADRNLVEGMRLRQRVFMDCKSCHLGKQKAGALSKELDRGIDSVNRLVFADLMFPQTPNGSRFKAVLHPDCPVKEIMTDNGGEFWNKEIDSWYQHHGIVHYKIPPHSSHMNLCERSHQTLTDAAADGEDEVEEPEPEGEPEPEDEPEPDEDGEVESIAETADEVEADAADVSALEDTDTPETEGENVDEEADSESEDQETYDSAAELTRDTDMEIDGVTEPDGAVHAGMRREREETSSEDAAEGMHPRKRRTGLREHDGDGEQEFSLYAALTYALEALGVETERFWHESGVRPPRTYKAAMNSLQHKEGWKGMEEEMAATEAKDVLELVSETEMPKGRKVLNTT
eukprot:jgi/Phyca11/14173/fgenesh1_pg.PHYCAscaffold_6_\